MADKAFGQAVHVVVMDLRRALGEAPTGYEPGNESHRRAVRDCVILAEGLRDSAYRAETRALRKLLRVPPPDAGC